MDLGISALQLSSLETRAQGCSPAWPSRDRAQLVPRPPGVSLLFPPRAPRGRFSGCPLTLGVSALSFPRYLLSGHPAEKLIKKESHLESVQWYVVDLLCPALVPVDFLLGRVFLQPSGSSDGAGAPRCGVC